MVITIKNKLNFLEVCELDIIVKKGIGSRGGVNVSMHTRSNTCTLPMSV